MFNSLTLSRNTLDLLNQRKSFIKNALKKYKDRQKFRIDRIKYAQTISHQELQYRLKKVIDKRSPSEIIKALHSTTNSSIWLGLSYYKFLSTSLDFRTALHDLEFSQEDQKLIELINSKRNISNYKKYTPDHIFSVVFRELEYSYHNPSYDNQIETPSINSTIVLVSGVFNEIFSTPAFERACKHLHRKFGIKYICPEVKGTRGVTTNSELLEKQLYEYIEMNPNEKLWVIGFSKGGIDMLHFLKHHKKFAEKYICGLSTIGSPILGSDHADHKIVRSVNFLHELFESWNLGHKDVLFKEIYESLSSSFQSPWFYSNYKNLPKLKFYTALALESTWYESHIWMLLTKAFFQSSKPNDGIVDVEHAQYPKEFGTNLGICRGHHLIGQRSSHFSQEALIEAHIVTLNKLGLLN